MPLQERAAVAQVAGGGIDVTPNAAVDLASLESVKTPQQTPYSAKR